MPRGIVWDNLDWANYPLAASAHRASAALVGLAATRRFSAYTTPNIYGTTYYAQIDGQSYLFGGHFAGGSYTGSGAGSTAELAGSVESGVVFTMALGSYFGDWDNPNNFLRAQIARGAGLASVWSGLPSWWLHPLGLGETIGACMRISVGNDAGLYAPRTDGWDASVGRGHLALHGDPTLRARYVGVPGALTVTASGSEASFTWTAPTDGADGYFLFELDPATDTLRRIAPDRIAGTTYRSSAITLVAGRTYAVRAARLETAATGTYWNLGLATLATATTSTGPSPDAGTPDAGASDAGSPMPGADAGPLADAGVSRTDAGAYDASGSPDAGTAPRADAGQSARLEGAMGCTIAAGTKRDAGWLVTLALIAGVCGMGRRRVRARR
jgi:hypothetical protein